ncbi:hypothetical protein BST81_19870 [Leptolyngbya sp. 'hensonii']|uniref:universal stress protein n=1 Tax=Leptolyngbya sp. 'hensonii' TaxID=1922337 RepID=UPI0009501101|nr:universal stress protein [Leptolyngbya sp. 'hensonii']OLP16698.1 hypothetical protein BST81_19870 [Leptolyngbya sp. 'hensonii']
MFEKILVAVDQSQSNQQVFDAALTMAKALNSQLMVFHVLTADEEGCPQVPLMVGMEYYASLDNKVWKIYEDQWKAYEEKGLNLLRSLTDEATAAGVATEFTQQSGQPGHTICEFAKLWKADLIVLGRRGHAGLQEMILGSVSNYVLHHAPCTVLTVNCPKVLNKAEHKSYQPPAGWPLKSIWS